MVFPCMYLLGDVVFSQILVDACLAIEGRCYTNAKNSDIYQNAVVARVREIKALKGGPPALTDGGSESNLVVKSLIDSRQKVGG